MPGTGTKPAVSPGCWGGGRGLPDSGRPRPRRRRPGPRPSLRGGWRVPPLTYSGNDGAHEVEGASEIPSGPNVIDSDAGHAGLLVLPEEVPELGATEVVAPGEVLQPFLPAFLGLPLRGQLDGREDGGAAQHVQHDQHRQQEEPRVVRVQATRAGAAAAATRHPPPRGTTLSRRHATSGPSRRQRRRRRASRRRPPGVRGPRQQRSGRRGAQRR